MEYLWKPWLALDVLTSSDISLAKAEQILSKRLLFFLVGKVIQNSPGKDGTTFCKEDSQSSWMLSKNGENAWFPSWGIIIWFPLVIATIIPVGKPWVSHYTGVTTGYTPFLLGKNHPLGIPSGSDMSGKPMSIPTLSPTVSYIPLPGEFPAYTHDIPMNSW